MLYVMKTNWKICPSEIFPNRKPWVQNRFIEYKIKLKIENKTKKGSKLAPASYSYKRQAAPTPKTLDFFQEKKDPIIANTAYN